VKFEATFDCEGVEKDSCCSRTNPDERINIPVVHFVSSHVRSFRLWIGPARHVKAVFETLFVALESPF
jgi:hypothetical protein